jgi:hypothetical protein
VLVPWPVVAGLSPDMFEVLGGWVGGRIPLGSAGAACLCVGRADGRSVAGRSRRRRDARGRARELRPAAASRRR